MSALDNFARLPRVFGGWAYVCKACLRSYEAPVHAIDHLSFCRAFRGVFYRTAPRPAQANLRRRNPPTQTITIEELATCYAKVRSSDTILTLGNVPRAAL